MLKTIVKKSVWYILNNSITLAVILGLLGYQKMVWDTPLPIIVLSEFELAEQKCLSEAVYFESGNQILEGQRRVAHAILVRKMSKLWPKSICKVISQGDHRYNKCQFSYRCDKKSDKPTNKNTWEVAKYVASMEYRKYIDGRINFGCAHSYIADYATNTGWHDSLNFKDQVGTHKFYCG